MISLKNEANTMIAEAIGTFALVLFGCSAIIINELHSNIITHLGISLVFGIIVMAVIYSVGNISGAHLNPAVTIGFLIAKRIKISKAIVYILAQLVGALTASFILKLGFPESTTLGATIPKVSWLFACIFEVILTFFLMFVILNVSTGHMEKGIMAGVAVGGTVFISALVGGPITGASMNPARSIGPAIFSLHITHLEIYIIAPILGAILASPFCKIIQGDECCDNNKIID